MSRFARSASWLRHLFTPAHSKQPSPGLLSDEVSLIQPYDGGGFPLTPVGEQMIRVTSATIAAVQTSIVTLREDEIGRILAVSALLSAGVAPVARVNVNAPNGLSCAISQDLAAVGLNFNTSMVMDSPILNPGFELLGQHTGGDAATIVIWTVILARAPIGTVFYV